MMDAPLTPLQLTYNTIPDITSYVDWEGQALPVGNGGIGASVFGGVLQERMQLNEKSLWSGGPAEGRDYKGGNIETNGQKGETLREVQRLFLEGHTEDALALCNRLTGVPDSQGENGYGFYLSFGNLYIDFDYGVGAQTYTDYVRTLDLRKAVVSVAYNIGGVRYKRESYVSYPDNVLVTHITVSGGKCPGLDISVIPDNTPGDAGWNVVNGGYRRRWTTQVKDGFISINGALDDNGMLFSAHTKVITDGITSSGPTGLRVEAASDILLITSMATDYKNIYPHYRTGETAESLSARVLGYVRYAAEKGAKALLKAHTEDYTHIFTRVELDLDCKVPGDTTDRLLQRYREGTASDEEMRYLEILFFQYGRYLTIAASRETPEGEPFRAQLPTNLQGMWVGANNSLWHADYHLNVNLQMNYWPAYTTNMAECARPLIDYVEGLRAPGRITAEIYAGIKSDEAHPENGFMAHTQNNPFGWTCPGWTFSWGWSPAAVPWILRNCYEYYLYTGDADYLREKIYPMMREAARFYDQFLIEDREGYLVSAPSYSPEHGPYTAGNTYEHALIWQLYKDTIEAAEILEADEDLVAIWCENQSRLKGPIQIGADGQIKEWYEETHVGCMPNTQAAHRHISHLLGLYPGDLISHYTPELMDAAKISLETRGEPTTGWSRAQRALCYARLGIGETAYEILSGIIKNVSYDNLLLTHPPFQIDASYGYTAAVSEMLLQSDGEDIYLLPALPAAWTSGKVCGLVARGNYEVSMKWKDGRIVWAKVKSNLGGKVKLHVPGDESIVLEMTSGVEQIEIFTEG